MIGRGQQLQVRHPSAVGTAGANVSTTAVVTDASGATRTRTTTTSYDGPGGNADRVKQVAVTGGVGQAVPVVSYGYDPATGLPTTLTSDASAGASLAGVVSQTYDDFGSPVLFTDADGATTTTGYDTASRPSTVTYKKADGTTVGSSTVAYNGGSEHRGLATSVTHSGLGGALSGSYDADGQLVSQTWPDGMAEALSYDPSGQPTSVTYVKGGNTFLSDQQVSTVHGQWASESGVLLPYARDYSYDAAGRLVKVEDTPADGGSAGCTTRVYGFDPAVTGGINSNRTSKQVFPAAVDGTCSTATTPATTSSTYDAADRLQPSGAHAGLAYDGFGRITTLPAVDAGGMATTVSYYVTDMVAATQVGSSVRSWTLDPAMRLRTETAEAGSSRQVDNHYGDGSSDAPVWLTDTDAAGAVSTVRMLPGLSGGLAATVTTGAVTGTSWQLVGLHGDVVRTTSPTATVVPDGTVNHTDEYGVASTPAGRYAYLGGAQRAVDEVSGLVYMGVRMYAPGLGRFLQADPILGGNTTPYGYPQDPINGTDITGLYSYQFYSASTIYWHGWHDSWSWLTRNWVTDFILGWLSPIFTYKFGPLQEETGTQYVTYRKREGGHWRYLMMKVTWYHYRVWTEYFIGKWFLKKRYAASYSYTPAEITSEIRYTTWVRSW